MFNNKNLILDDLVLFDKHNLSAVFTAVEQLDLIELRKLKLHLMQGIEAGVPFLDVLIEVAEDESSYFEVIIRRNQLLPFVEARIRSLERPEGQWPKVRRREARLFTTDNAGQTYEYISGGGSDTRCRDGHIRCSKCLRASHRCWCRWKKSSREDRGLSLNQDGRFH